MRKIIPFKKPPKPPENYDDALRYLHSCPSSRYELLDSGVVICDKCKRRVGYWQEDAED